MSQYRTGTASGTNGSNIITGTGTSWLSEVSTNDFFIAPDKVAYVIASVDSDTQITLSVNYPNATFTDQSYAIHRDFLNGFGLWQKGDVEPQVIFNDLVKGVANAQTTLNGLGTAATHNVQTSSTDTTVDAVLKVGAFGLGNDGTQLLINDADTALTVGFYRWNSTSVNVPEPGGFGLLIVNRYNSSNITQIATRNAFTNKLWMRQLTGSVWGNWERIDPHAFGWGIADGVGAEPGSSLDTLFTTGTYRYINTTIGIPSGTGSDFGQVIVTRYSNTNLSQIAINNVGQMFLRNYTSGGGWGSWQRIDPQAFGLGVNVGIRPPNNDLNDIDSSGLYNINGGDSNTPAGVGGYLIHIPGDSGGASGNGAQLVFSQASSEDVKVFARVKLSGAWQSWKQIDPQAFGWGDTSKPGNQITDLDAENTSRVVRFDSLAVNPPTQFGTLTTQVRSSVEMVQMAQQVNGHGLFTRYKVSGAWSSRWAAHYHTENVLGTVSQSAGVPTGAIIERGSNANGEYVKFADGTLICTQGLTSSISSSLNWTFPAVFAGSTPRIQMQAITGAPRIITVENTALASIDYNGFDSTDGTREIVSIHAVATGRWF